MSATSGRRTRGFKRWMNHHGIECSDALRLSTQIGESDDPSRSLSVSVQALCDLKEGDVVAVIPKQSCLTVRTSAASCLIEETGLGGYLALVVAVMYEKSLGPLSKWFQYLQILPSFEPIPLLWSLSEIDSLLSGTELHKTIKEDKALIYQDWKECIKPLLASFNLNLEFFTVDAYLAAKSLVASRAFQIDAYHGFGMVPLADLFNHKTAAENVHFTAVSSSSESDSDVENNEQNDYGDEIGGDTVPTDPDLHSETEASLEASSLSENEPTFLEMVVVKDVKAGNEVFNTYGSLGNAALLHRYAFTELDNPFDIVNIDLDVVVQWSLTLFSSRSSRKRLTFWRKLGYSACDSQNSEYFEVSLEGKPQGELLLLLYIMLLPEVDFQELDLFLSIKGTLSSSFLAMVNFPSTGLELRKTSLLIQKVGEALHALADARESFYGPSSLEDDVRLLDKCCVDIEPKLYHSLVLRISERRIIGRLRSFAASGNGILSPLIAETIGKCRQ